MAINPEKEKEADETHDYEWTARLNSIEESTERLILDFEMRNDEKNRSLEEKMNMNILALKEEFEKHVAEKAW
eukprot:CAMPEP_0172508238 /NCGR_PEP_ID=MMETSP1066-20121228/210488_1 /TAXON_ID=671091 /ORGANISM="Coscinodiscus wailesii, Strain CCMP2513" /LENGTH=72 /DNA_ID=CAMNT_0013286143 /DNA_START=563 /DNA_END=778 /DNA_ORIENTATION=-